MLDLIEKIGPLVGLAAFIGLAVLAFLIFQQSRDIRRLRDWAGRAPERAKEADDASTAAAEARGEAAGEERPGRFARARASVAGAVGPRYQAFDRHLPIDGRIVLGILAAAVIVAGVLTSGFGLVGDGGGGESVVMFEPEQEGAAAEFARAIQAKLGETATEPIADDIRQASGDAPVVLVIGADDQSF